MTGYRNRNSLVLIGAVLVLLIPLVLCGFYVVQKHAAIEERLADVEPRFARFLGIESQRQEVEETLARVQTARAKYVYPAQQDAAQAGNAAQQRLRDIFTNAGLQVSSSQVLPLKVEKGFDRIPLAVRAEGELASLLGALAVLSSQAPLIVINDLDVQVQGGLSASNKLPPRLTAQFNLSVFRDRS